MPPTYGVTRCWVEQLWSRRVPRCLKTACVVRRGLIPVLSQQRVPVGGRSSLLGSVDTDTKEAPVAVTGASFS